MKLKALFLSVVILMTGMSASLFAQSGNEEKKKDAQAVSGTDPFAGMETAIIEVKYKNARELADVVRILASQRGLVQDNREIKTIMVRDYPENLVKIKAAIERLDVEGPKPNFQMQDNYEVQLYLIATSRTSTNKSDLPTGLEPVITQLQETLRYKGYRYITTFLNRVQHHDNVQASGITDPMFPLAVGSGKSFYNYKYALDSVTDAEGKAAIRLSNFRFSINTPIATSLDAKAQVQYNEVGIGTSVVMREGDKVVVGTANLGSSDEAVIVVVSAKKLK